MKKIFLMCAVAAAALGFSSCSETWENNPVLVTHEGVKTADFLNEPNLQDQVLMITQDNREGSLHLTCSQPDYGYAAIATYKVQVSLTPDFTEYEEIAQAFYNCAEINPLNGDVAAAIEKLSGVRTEDDLPLACAPVYMRLRCYIEQSPENTEYLSNVVHFNNIGADYLAIWVADVPVDIYIRGGVNDWGTGEEWQFVTGPEEDTWVINNVTIAANVSIKIADATWGTLNLGGNAGEDASSQMVTPGEEIELTGGSNPGHIRLTENFTGKVVLRLEAGTYYVTFDPAL